MKILIGLVMTYILAAPLTERISLDLRLTHWWDIVTYIIWATSGMIWGAGLLFVLFLLSRLKRY